jgi:hypothetical protein
MTRHTAATAPRSAGAQERDLPGGDAQEAAEQQRVDAVEESIVEGDEQGNAAMTRPPTRQNAK